MVTLFKYAGNLRRVYAREFGYPTLMVLSGGIDNKKLRMVK